ncbi:MAG: thymidine kinase [Acidobacteriota bacterium]
MDVFRSHPGWIEVITGSMFSGKSEELIRRLRRSQIARQRVQVFKARVDSRYSKEHIVSHSDMRIDAELVQDADEILEKLDHRTEVVGIDEGQFFDLRLVKVCIQLANMGKRVIVAGLDQDYLGQPFEPMPQLLAVAEYITKTLAICVRCGNPANHTQRLVASTDRVVVGGPEAYEARCRRCFEPQPASHRPREQAKAGHRGEPAR